MFDRWGLDRAAAIATLRETDAASTRAAGRRSVQFAAVGLITLLYAIAVLGPSARHGYSTDLDSSWPLFLHHAFAHGLQFGPDVVYTFGPWGFLFDRSPGLTAGASLLAWATLSVAMWAAAVAVARRRFRSPFAALAWLVAFLASVASTSDGTFFGMVALYLFGELVDTRPPRARDAHRWLLLAALALAGLVKFPYLVSAAVIVGLLAARSAWRRREAPIAPFVFVAGLVGAWVLAGQSIANLPSYLRWATEIVRSYPQAMSLTGPFREVVAVSAGFVLLVLLAVWIADRRDRPWVAVLLSALLFIVLKASVVRHDGLHVLTSAGTLTSVALLELAWWRPPPAGTQRIGVPLGLLVCSGIGLWLFASRAGSRWEVLTHPIAAMQRQLGSLTSRSGAAAGPQIVDESLSRVRAEHPLPSIGGTVDVYPWQAALPIAYGLRYAPRPVFQSFQATSEALAALNADHLRGPDAPDDVLFDVQTVDGRLPALDDAPSWPVLWSRYEADVLTPSFVVLKRRLVPAVLAPPRLLERRRVSLGEPFAVPSPESGVVWAEIHLDETLIGKAMSLAFRPQAMTVKVTTADGLLRAFRLVPELARGGFVLSPLVLDRMAFITLWTSPRSLELRELLEGDAVTSVEVVADRRSHVATFEVSLYRIDLPEEPMPAWYDDAAAKYLAARLADRGVDELVSAALHRGLTVDVRQSPDGPVFFAHAPFELPLRHHAADLMTLEFGVLDGAWSNGGATDGVTFSLIGDCRTSPLWSRVLRPVENPADRGLQRATIPIPETCRGTAITLRTTPVGTTAWDWSYWRRAR